MENKIENKDAILEITKESWESQWNQTTPIDTDSLLLNHLIYEGYHKEAQTFANEKNLIYEPDNQISERNLIRKKINEGLIDDAISILNDINSEILDKNVYLYYVLSEQRVAEMIFSAHENDYEEKVVDIIEFIRNELVGVIEEKDESMKYLEDLLEYLVFNNEEIEDRRRKTNLYVNQCIMETTDFKNNLKEILRNVYHGEKKLEEKYKFPFYESYLNYK
ncbi:hypothetical protein GVAV_000187 [Gurleya vavrai]